MLSSRLHCACLIRFCIVGTGILSVTSIASRIEPRHDEKVSSIEGGGTRVDRDVILLIETSAKREYLVKGGSLQGVRRPMMKRGETS